MKIMYPKNTNAVASGKSAFYITKIKIYYVFPEKKTELIVKRPVVQRWRSLHIPKTCPTARHTNTFEATPSCPTSNAGARAGSRKSTAYPSVFGVEPTGRAVLKMEGKTRPTLKVDPVSARAFSRVVPGRVRVQVFVGEALAEQSFFHPPRF